METLMAQTTGDTLTYRTSKTCHCSHSLCVCACVRVCVRVYIEIRGSSDPERIGTVG